MFFDSIGFLLFFPIVVLLYFAFPKKWRYIWLLVTSYFFYLCISAEYTIFLILSTLITYIGARFMNTKHKKVVLWSCLISNLSVLCVCKHGIWGLSILKRILNLLDLQISVDAIGIVLPVGMSFYMFQSLGYLIDVYRRNAQPEKNFAKYALFVSFFPTILSGPIERSGNLLKQIQSGTEFLYDNARKGLLMMAFGYFEKILIANRIAILVDNAYENYLGQTGAALAFAVFLYAIQIYADFAGYSYIAIGTAKVLGFDLIENFKQPYFALSIKAFWKRWHISLSQWLRDYVYISMGGSRCSKIKTYRNLFITFLISGFWHGTGMNYIVWGALHGGYQIAGDVSQTLRMKIKKSLRINENCWSYKLFQGVITFLLVDFAWLFFRATSLSQALGILKKIVLDFRLGETIFYRTYLFGMEQNRAFILFVEILVVLLIDVIHEKGGNITLWFKRQNLLFRWSFYFAVAVVLLVGALYNYGVNASTFIYSQF